MQDKVLRGLPSSRPSPPGRRNICRSVQVWGLPVRPIPRLDVQQGGRSFTLSWRRAGARSRKFYFDGGQVEIAAELVHELDPDGKQLRVIKLTDYTAEKVRTLCASPDELRARWADSGQRAEIIQQLAERGIDFHQVALQAGKPDADPFDLLCHLAFNAPILTRRQRADRTKKTQVAFFNFFAPESREILNDLLEKYAADGELQFTLPDALKVRPISDHGKVNEIINKFGGSDQLRNAVNQLQLFLDDLETRREGEAKLATKKIQARHRTALPLA